MTEVISDDNPIEEGSKLNYFKGLYYRNKTVLALSLGIFVILLFLGIIFGYFQSEFLRNLLKTYINMLKSANIEINTFYIFYHNFQAASISYIGGIIGIVPFLVLSFNGFIYGAFLGYLLHGNMISNTAMLTPGMFLAYTLPHGIIEFIGFIVSGAAGFRLTTFVYGSIKSIIRKTPVNVHYWKFKDSLSLFILATLLILIAAIIEANLTISIGNYITGMKIP